MLGDIILEDHKVGRYGPGRNQGHFSCLFICNKSINSMSVKVTLIVTDIQLVDNVASYDGVKRWLVV